VNAEGSTLLAERAVKRSACPTIVVVGVANYIAAIPTTNTVEKLPASRAHRAQARGELGLAIELPQFGGQEMPNLQHRLHTVRGDFPGVRSVEDAAIFKESDEAASCRYFQFRSLPGDTAKRRRDAREPVRNL
jgi:hypothetical protein